MMVLVRYGELALKGRNRGAFEKKLVDNLRFSLKGLPVKVKRIYGRIMIEIQNRDHYREVASHLERTFGIVSFSPVESSPLHMPAINEKAAEIAGNFREPPFTFKIETRRANKTFPEKSPEISNQVGEHILNSIPGLQVDVHEPELKLHIEIREQEAFFFHSLHPGPGGLPVGVSGKALLLLSGGIDSPVAGWMGMKRGLVTEALHFHSFPFTSDRALEKVVDLTRVLSRYGLKIKLHIAGFTAIQKAIHQHCPPAMSITIMRRMMFRVADAVARQRGIKAIITGESLGQVASQTLDSICVTDPVIGLPVFRPLIGMDKQEIVEIARKIDTYPISIQPYEDCCTVFLPRNPETAPILSRTENAEKALPVQELLIDCLKNLESTKPGK